MIRKRDVSQNRSGCSIVSAPAILPSFSVCGLRERRVLAREDLVLAFGQRDRAVYEAIDLGEAGRIELAGRHDVPAADQDEALAALGDEHALLDQLVLRADDVVRRVLLRRELAHRIGERGAHGR